MPTINTSNQSRDEKSLDNTVQSLSGLMKMARYAENLDVHNIIKRLLWA